MIRTIISAILPAILLLSSYVWAQPNCAAPHVNSQKLEWLEDNDSERDDWLRERSRESNARLGDSPNKEPVENWLRKAFDVPVTLKIEELSPTREFRIVDRGLGKPTDLVEVDPTNTTIKEKIIFSTFQFRKNNTLTFLSFSVNHSKELVALTFAENGSTDDYLSLVINIKTGKIVSPYWQTQSSHVSWVGERTVLLGRLSKDKKDVLTRYEITDTKTSKAVSTEYGELISRTGSWGLHYSAGAESVFHFTHANGFQIDLKDCIPKEIIGPVGDYLYFEARGANHMGEVRRIRVHNDKAKLVSASEVVHAEGDMVISDVTTKDGFIFIKKYFGNNRVVDVLKIGHKGSLRIQVPDCCTAGPLKLSEDKKALEINLYSPVVKVKAFRVDLKTGAILGKNIEKQMLTDTSGSVYKSYVIEAVSADGTKIPVRVTHKKGLKLDGSNPALIQAYGGFRIPKFYPGYETPTHEFLKRGGVLTTAALRGGNEFGEDWHKAGMQENKKNTFADLAATAKALKDLKYSPSEKIITYGGSNGGLVVSASALLHPENFGLVIDLNGVHDMFGKERLDPRHGSGWTTEYGDSREEKAAVYLSNYSPVELPAVRPQKLPNFLLVVGKNDSRVNPAHSYKFVEALFDLMGPEAESKVEIAAINNSGHWNSSATYQDLIGWRANVIIWTRIFDHLGWLF